MDPVGLSGPGRPSRPGRPQGSLPPPSSSSSSSSSPVQTAASSQLSHPALLPSASPTPWPQLLLPPSYRPTSHSGRSLGAAILSYVAGGSAHAQRELKLRHTCEDLRRAASAHARWEGGNFTSPRMRVAPQGRSAALEGRTGRNGRRAGAVRVAVSAFVASFWGEKSVFRGRGASGCEAARRGRGERRAVKESGRQGRRGRGLDAQRAGLGGGVGGD